MGSRDASAPGAADAASAEQASSSRPGELENRPPVPGSPVRVTGPSPSSSSQINITTNNNTNDKNKKNNENNHPPSPSAGLLAESSSRPAPTSFPISIPPIFFQRSRAPSASVAPSTAEGKPVPLTDSTGDRHTSAALQKLNSKYPSAVRRHGYAQTTGAPSSTYSQPVIVRTYSGPPRGHGSRNARPPRYRAQSSGRAVLGRVPLPSSSTPGSSSSLAGRPIQPAVSDVGVGTTSSTDTHSAEISGIDAHGVNMPSPHKAKKAASGSKLPLPWQWHSASSRQEPEEPKLPPLEAFTFKSFMADLQARGGENDIGADLDRIAEICARSRYSLSNQYEVHVAPHGSGASFASGVGVASSSAPRKKKGHSHSYSQGHGTGGPTLQAIPSEDEASIRSHPRRRNGARRKSAAYGTLETIMSSSRSSDEDKSKKKPAAELVSKVRGRVAGKMWSASASASASATASTGDGGSADAQAHRGAQQHSESHTAPADDSKLARQKPASLASAIIESGRSSSGGKNHSSSSSSHHRQPSIAAAAAPSSSSSTSSAAASALVSDPAMPQTSNSHLGVRTSAGHARPRADDSLPHHGAVPPPTAGRAPSAGTGLLAAWSAWIPWGTGQTRAGPAAAAAAASAGGGSGGASAPSHAEGILRQLLVRSVGGAGSQPERGR